MISIVMKSSLFLLLLAFFALPLVTQAQQPLPKVVPAILIAPACTEDLDNCISCADSFNEKEQKAHLQLLLYNAIQKLMNDCVSHMIALGIDPNHRTNDGLLTTPLNIAVRYNSANITTQLISAGANPDLSDGLGVLPIYEAIKSKHCALIPLIFAKRGNINPAVTYKSDKMTAFIVALIGNNFECLRELTLLGIDINRPISKGRQDMIGFTPLMICLTFSHIELAKRIVNELGADTEARNAKGDTALLAVTRMNHFKAAKALVEEMGADVWARDKHGNTPADVAISKKLALYLAKIQNSQGLFYQISELCHWMWDATWEERITYTVSTIALAIIPSSLIFLCCRAYCRR